MNRKILEWGDFCIIFDQLLLQVTTYWILRSFKLNEHPAWDFEAKI